MCYGGESMLVMLLKDGRLEKASETEKKMIYMRKTMGGKEKVNFVSPVHGRT
jgi:hypothetical protein